MASSADCALSLPERKAVADFLAVRSYTISERILEDH